MDRWRSAFRKAFKVSLMNHANQIREKYEDVPGVSLSVHFMKCSMNRHERTTVVWPPRKDITWTDDESHFQSPRDTPVKQAECDQERRKTTRPSCESVSRSRPRYRLHQTFELGQATVQIIFNSATWPCNLCHLISAKSSCKSSSPLGHAPTRTVRISLQARPWSVGTSTRAVARACAGNLQPRFPLNTVGQQLANLASIHPQFLKGRIRQPPCSDQRTDTCSRNLMKHKRSSLKRVELYKRESKPGRRALVCANSWLPAHLHSFSGFFLSLEKKKTYWKREKQSFERDGEKKTTYWNREEVRERKNHWKRGLSLFR